MRILDKGIYPQCNLYRMQTNPSVMYRTHEGTALCRTGAAKRRAHDAVVESRRALTYYFFVEGRRSNGWRRSNTLVG